MGCGFLSLLISFFLFLPLRPILDWRACSQVTPDPVLCSIFCLVPWKSSLLQHCHSRTPTSVMGSPSLALSVWKAGPVMYSWLRVHLQLPIGKYPVENSPIVKKPCRSGSRAALEKVETHTMVRGIFNPSRHSGFRVRSPSSFKYTLHKLHFVFVQ